MELPFKMIQNSGKEKWRAETFWTKEPETIEWINTFEPNAVFYDVGANVGVYSLYAASRSREAKVLAFEPHIANYITLVQNARMNGFQNIIPIMAAIADRCDFSRFSADSKEAGSSGGQVGRVIKSPVLAYAVVVLTLDEAMAMYLWPTHIKIDIDGQEFAVLKGMEKMLKAQIPKSILMECNTEGIVPHTVREYMNSFGYHSGNHLNYLENHSRKRRKEEGINVENIIFERRG